MRSIGRRIITRATAAYVAFAGVAPRQAVLCYHRLRLRADDTGPGSARALPVEDFERQLDWLAGFCEFVPLGALIEWRAAPPRRWRVAVTFDDGYADTLDLGLPAMLRYGIRPTVFVTTGFVADHGSPPLWVLMDLAAARAPDRLAALVGARDVAEACRIVRHRFRTTGPPSLARLRRQLSDIAGDPGPSLFPSVARLRQAAREDTVDFEAHTVNHPSLTVCDDADLVREIVAGRDQLEAWTGKRSRWFAFPFGGKGEVDARTALAVRKAGFEGALTLIPGYVGKRGDPFRLPRVPIGTGHSLADFRSRVLAAPILRLRP